MAMNYAWQERKKFMIPVVTGVVVLLIWYLFILSSINGAADRDLQTRKLAEGQLRLRMQSGVPTDESVARAERDKATFEKDLKEIQDKLVFRVDDAFKAKEGQSTAGKFGSQRQAVHQNIEKARIPRGLDEVDKNKGLGFPSTFASVPEPVLAEWLIRLAVVQRICLFAMDCNVAGIKLMDVVPADTQEEPSLAADKFLGVLTVKFKVTGTADTIIRLVHGLQQEGPYYLAIEAGEITLPNSMQNQLSAVLTAGALVVRPEAPLVAEAKQ
jgi:hypothetical protein